MPFYIQLELFTAFKRQYPGKAIGVTTFMSLKPWFIRRLKEWNTCYCHYHQEIRELLNGFNEMRTDDNGLHSKGESCKCTCPQVCTIPVQTCVPTAELPIYPRLCQSKLMTYTDVTELWQSLLCPIEGCGPWLQKLCLMEKCIHCGVKF
jgi:hypothetical protein